MNKTVSAFLAVALLLLFFSVTLQKFLFSDDIQNFMLKNSLVTAHPQSSFIQVASEESSSWMKQGRFTPLSFLWQDGIFMNVPSVAAYRWFVLLMNFAGIAAFLFFLHTLNVNINSAVWVACLCAVMQFRIQYHDAYTSLNGMYQLLAVLVFLSVGFFVLFIKSRQWYFMFFSLLLYALAHLQSEVGISAFFFIPATALLLKVPLGKTIKYFSPYLLATALYLTFVVWLKAEIADKSSIYEGFQSNFDIHEMLGLLQRQMYSCLPLTNLHRQIALPEILAHRFELQPVITACIVALSLAILLYYRRPIAHTHNRFNWIFVLYVLLLMTVPALFILPSVKYQKTLQMGSGYLPVYLQNLGTATLLAYIAGYLSARSSYFYKTAKVVFSVFIAICTGITFLFNSALINARMYELSSPSIAQYKSVKNGLMKNVPEGSTVLIGYFWQSAWMYDEIFIHLCSKKFAVVNADEYHPSPADTANTCYLLESTPGNPISTKLYEMNCTTREQNKILAEAKHDCDIQETEREKVILHRIFNR